MNQAQIDQIVRDVLSKLGNVGERAAATTAPLSSGSPCDELSLADHVVTLETLTGQLEGVRTLIVGKKAIVTPAANDELRDRKIECVRCDTRVGNPPTNQTPGALLLGAVDQQQLEAAAKSIDTKTEFIVAKTLIDVVGQLGARVAANKSCGVVLTERTAAAVCLANRHRHIRAVQVGDFAAARDAATSVGANVLIVDERGMSAFVLNRIVQTIGIGPRSCPAELQLALEAN